MFFQSSHLALNIHMLNKQMDPKSMSKSRWQKSHGSELG